MATRDEIESVLKAAYAARVKGDIAGIRAVFAPNVTFQVAGSDKASPMCTTACGRDDVDKLMENMIATFVLKDFEFVEMLIEGSKAAVRWRATIHHTGTDQVFSTELADFIEVQNGQIVSFVEFLDTALATQVLAAKA